MTTIYHSSTGEKVIAEMNYHNLAAAHAKLKRERLDDSRDAEIAAMAERIAINDAEFEAEQLVTGGAA